MTEKAYMYRFYSSDEYLELAESEQDKFQKNMRTKLRTKRRKLIDTILAAVNKLLPAEIRNDIAQFKTWIKANWKTIPAETKNTIKEWLEEYRNEYTSNDFSAKSIYKGPSADEIADAAKMAVLCQQYMKAHAEEYENYFENGAEAKPQPKPQPAPKPVEPAPKPKSKVVKNVEPEPEPVVVAKKKKKKPIEVVEAEEETDAPVEVPKTKRKKTPQTTIIE